MTKDAVSFKRESCAERVQWVASWLDFANSSAVPRYRGDFFGSGGSMAQGKERADELVFAQGLAESREMAKRLIMAGKVALEDVSGVRQKVDKPGHKYPLDTAFALVGIEKYVSRGAYKLLTAIEHFKLDDVRVRLSGRRGFHGRVYGLPAAARRGEGVCGGRGQGAAP